MRHDRFEGDEALDELRGPNRMTTLFVVMLAGSLGVGMRYLLDAAITSAAGDSFPWSTLIINIVGAAALGVLAGALASHPINEGMLRPALAIGLLGGFTTFSAFALEAIELTEQGSLAHAAIYVAATNLGGIAAAVGGVAAGRLLVT